MGLTLCPFKIKLSTLRCLQDRSLVTTIWCPYLARPLREGVLETEESLTTTFPGGAPKSHFFLLIKNPLYEAPKQTLCSLLTSDMLDMASNSMLNTSLNISSTSVADTRKW